MKIITVILFLVANSIQAQENIILQLKALVGVDWKLDNPKLAKTTHSFFTKSSIKGFYIAPIKWSGTGHPFIWDPDLSALEFISDQQDSYEILKGTAADENYKGTKITWTNAEATIWANGKYNKTQVSRWHLLELNECVGTTMFPFIKFNPTYKPKNPRNNNQDGLVFIGKRPDQPIITKSAILTTAKGKQVAGTGFDLNDDGTFDLFGYTQNLDNDGNLDFTDSYYRLYANVDGHWKCIYQELDEVCI